MTEEMQQDDPIAEMKRRRAKQAAPPVDLNDPIEELKRRRAAVPGQHDYHAEYASGALAQRMEGANARDATSAAEQDAVSAGPVRAAGQALAATGANIAQGIPGMERAQAAIGTIGTGDSYSQSLGRLRETTGKIPAPLRTAERVAGSIPLLAIPGARALSPVAGGAILGGADQALSADEMSGTERLERTGAGAAAGAVMPKLIGGAGRVATKIGLADAVGEGVRQIGSDARRTVSIPFLSKVGGAVEGVGERFGTRGVVNKEMEGVNRLVKPLGGIVGERPPSAPTLLRKVGERSDAGAVNYPKALGEADAATTAYRASRKGITDENVQRAADLLRSEADQSTTQSAALVPNRVPTIQEAIDNLRSAKGEVARRAQGGTAPNTNPFSSQPAAETVAQQKARETLERQSAERSLPSTVSDIPPKPLLDVPGKLHPSVAPLYENPTISKVAAGLKKLREFRGIGKDDPRFLDAIYKVFSDQKSTLAQRIDNATDPLNLGRYTKSDIQGAQSQILGAMDGLGSTYRDAVAEHAQRSAWIEAFNRGNDMVAGGSATSKSLLKKSPEAFSQWLAKQMPEMQDAAQQGVKQAMRGQAANIPLEGGRAGAVSARPFRSVPKDAAKRDLVSYPENVRTDVAAEAAADVTKPSALRTIAARTPVAGRLVAVEPKNKIAEVFASPQGVRMLAEIRKDPTAYQAVLKRYGHGKTIADALVRAGLVGGNAAITGH